MGQDSIHFVDSTATWNVAKTYPHGDIQHPFFVETLTKVYGFDGDTLFENKLWNKIYSTSDSDFFSNKTYLGNLREENGLVIFIDTSNVIDTIYDFNLLIGDSIKYDFGIDSSYISISSIDSILINGSYHKRFFFTEPTGPNAFTILQEIWIEGIGSVHGPLFPAKPAVFSTEMPDSMYLTCYKNNDTIIWSNPYYNECYINIALSLNDSPETIKGILIFPNPVTYELTIDLPQNTGSDFIISIFDLTGKIVFRQNYQSSDKIIIDTRYLNNSFYIMQIKSTDKIYWTNFIRQ